MQYMVETKNLRKVYRTGDEKVVALDNIDLTIEQGQVCCILGTSGSGKSTLLNQLAGLEKPTRGTVKIKGELLSKMSEKQLAVFRQKHIGFVFQSYNLIQGMTAVENVAMPLMFRRVSRKKREEAAREMLKQVGLGERMDHRPNEMSGGQQQRVGIARAFVTNPEVVFADEPTGNLDTKTTKEVMEMFLRFAREKGTTPIPRRSKNLPPPLPRSCRRNYILPITHWPPAKEEYDCEKDEQDPDIHSGAGHGAGHRSHDRGSYAGRQYPFHAGRNCYIHHYGRYFYQWYHHRKIQ